MHICDIHNCDYLSHTTFRFYLIDFQLDTDFPSSLRFFVKSPTVTQRLVSQENAFKKSKNPSPFLSKSVGLDNYFTLDLPWPKPSTPVGDCVMASDPWCLARSSCLTQSAGICQCPQASSFLTVWSYTILPTFGWSSPRSVFMDMWYQHQIWLLRWAHPFDMTNVA